MRPPADRPRRPGEAPEGNRGGRSPRREPPFREPRGCDTADWSARAGSARSFSVTDLPVWPIASCRGEWLQTALRRPRATYVAGPNHLCTIAYMNVYRTNLRQGEIWT